MAVATEVVESGTSDQNNVPKGPKFGIRHVQMILLFSLIAIAYASRFNVSVAIVAMTSNSSSNPDIPVYDWTDNSVVLSAFYWGYVVFPIPAALLAGKYGAKWFLVTIMTINGACCFMIPFIADTFGSNGLKGCRVLQGLVQGFVYPSVHTMLGLWAPATERSSLSGYVYSGTYVGNILGLILTGLLSSSWYGWPSSFYLFGALNIVWVTCMVIFGSSKPSIHKSITKEEQNYIESSLGQEEKVELRTPWMSIIKSTAFWAVFAPNLGTNFGITLISTETPTYMSKILGYDISMTSILSALPNASSWIGAMIFSPTCDYLINSQIVSRKNARKIFNTIGMALPGIILFCIGFIPKDLATVVVIFFVCIGFVQPGYMCGYHTNFIDIAPNHAGTLMGMSNGTTNVFAILAPLVVNFIVTEETSQDQWKIALAIGALILFATNVIFVIFCQGEIQSWNYERKVNQAVECTSTEESNEQKDKKFRY